MREIGEREKVLHSRVGSSFLDFFFLFWRETLKCNGTTMMMMMWMKKKRKKKFLCQVLIVWVE